MIIQVIKMPADSARWGVGTSEPIYAGTETCWDGQSWSVESASSTSAHEAIMAVPKLIQRSGPARLTSSRHAMAQHEVQLRAADRGARIARRPH
jgi:hypothetical protein